MYLVLLLSLLLRVTLVADYIENLCTFKDTFNVVHSGLVSYNVYRVIDLLKKTKLYTYPALFKVGMTEAPQNYISSQALQEFSLKLEAKSKESMKSREPHIIMAL